MRDESIDRIVSRVRSRDGVPSVSTSPSKPRMQPDIVCMADVVPVVVPWLWPERIACGRITLLSGRPGAGKTFLTADIAARVSQGILWPDGSGIAPVGSVLLLNAEDDPADTLAPRLIGAGANRNKIHVLRAAKLIESDGNEKSIAFDLANLDIIRAALDGLPDCRLLILDPIGSYLGGRTDSHRDSEVRAILSPLAMLASERELAVVLVCHNRKSSVDFADDAVLGSRAFTGLARSVWHLSDDADDRERKLFLPGKCNLARSPNGLAFRIGDGEQGYPVCEWEADAIETHADDVVHTNAANGISGPAPLKRNAAMQWLRELLASGPMFVEDIKEQARNAGFSISTIQRAKDELGLVPAKQSFAGRWQWELAREDTQVEAEKNMDSPRCSRDVEHEHLGENKGENAPNAPRKAQDTQVAPHLSILDDQSEDAQVPWNDFDRFVEAMRAANWKWDDVKKWLGLPHQTSFIKVSDADRQKAYQMFTKKKTIQS